MRNKSLNSLEKLFVKVTWHLMEMVCTWQMLAAINSMTKMSFLRISDRIKLVQNQLIKANAQQRFLASQQSYLQLT